MRSASPAEATAITPGAMPDVVDQVALARLYGEPLFALPQDLYIPPRRRDRISMRVRAL